MLKKVLSVVLALVMIMSALSVLTLVSFADYEEITNNVAYVLMFSGIVWLTIVAIIYLVKAVRGDSRDEAKKAVATGFFALIWTMNTMFMSADIMYTIAEFICSLSLLIIVYDVITLEEKKPKVIVERRANRS